MHRPRPPLPGKPGATLAAQAKQAAERVAGKIQHAAGTVQQGLQHVRPGVGLPGKVRGGLDLSALVARADASMLAGAPTYRELREHLLAVHQRDGGESLLADFDAMARDQRRRLEGLVRHGLDIAGNFRDPRSRQRLKNEVLLPAQRNQISGPVAMERLTQIAGRVVLGDGDALFPNWTTGIGIVGSAGLGLGGEVAIGLCGVRNRQPCVFRAAAVSFGATASAEVVVQVQFAPSPPLDFGGLSVGYSLGGGYNATAGVGIAFVPKRVLTGPLFKDRWAFDGLAVQLGGGGGADLSISLEYCNVQALRPA